MVIKTGAGFELECSWRAPFVSWLRLGSLEVHSMLEPKAEQPAGRWFQVERQPRDGQLWLGRLTVVWGRRPAVAAA